MNDREKEGLPLVESAYKEMLVLFEMERLTFACRRGTIDERSASRVFWSSAYLDFFPNESLLDGLKPAKIYSKERKGSIKNYGNDNEPFFSCHNDNERWGCLFIEHCDNIKKSLFFVENDNEVMELRRLRLAYIEGERYRRVFSYSFNSDDDEETLIIDVFQYAEYGISEIVRYGFWGDCTTRLPVRVFACSPSGSITISTETTGILG